MQKRRINEEQIYEERKNIKELELLLDCGHPKLHEIKRLIAESEQRLADLLEEKKQLDEAENNERYD
jgi:hypothetical protein